MSDNLVLVGASYRSTPLATRERLAVPRARRVPLLRELADRLAVRECFWVSTCNRTEVYVRGSTPDEVRRALAATTGFPYEEIAATTYTSADVEAARHLYRVAAGLDSLVIGETQILGQLRQAEMTAREAGTHGPLTAYLVQRALRTGRQVRRETGISRGAGSVSSAAIRLAQAVCGDLSDRMVLLIGAGEVAELVARALAGAGARRTVVVNRTHQRAESLARRFGGRAHPYAQTPRLLAEADIVVSSTDAPHPVVRRRTLTAVRATNSRPLCVIDLAVPRNVEPEVGNLAGVSLYNVDDLQAVVDRDIAGRTREAQAAETLVAEAVDEYRRWLGARRMGPAVAAFRNQAHETRLRELDRWQRRLASLDPAERETVAALTRAIVNKILHTPSVRLKDAAAGPDGDAYREALRDLFSLNEPPVVTN